MAKKSNVKLNKRNTRKFITLVVLVLIAIFVIVCYFNPEFYNKVLSIFETQEDLTNDDSGNSDVHLSSLGELTVHFIDIGQGDAIFIELPDSKNVLIDSGDLSNTYNTKLVNYIKALQVTQIDYVIATHADSDHIGGMEDIFINFEVKMVYRPYVKYSGTDYTFDSDFNKGGGKYSQKSKTYGEFLDYINKETYLKDGVSSKCSWEYFDSNSDFGANLIVEDKTYSYTFDFLTSYLTLDDIDYSDANDYSPFIKFSYCDFDILFTGDAEAEAESEFVYNYKNTEANKAYCDVDLLKVSHHGSSTSTTSEFLAIVKPEIAIISCGEGNKYGHPRQDVLDRLETYGCSNIYRTDLNGNIVLTVNTDKTYQLATDRFSDKISFAPTL